jgi:hypothetical protein
MSKDIDFDIDIAFAKVVILIEWYNENKES